MVAFCSPNGVFGACIVHLYCFIPDIRSRRSERAATPTDMLLFVSYTLVVLIFFLVRLYSSLSLLLNVDAVYLLRLFSVFVFTSGVVPGRSEHVSYIVTRAPNGAHIHLFFITHSLCCYWVRQLLQLCLHISSMVSLRNVCYPLTVSLYSQVCSLNDTRTYVRRGDAGRTLDRSG